MLSLLGLIVFPWATGFQESVESLPLECVKGEAHWKIELGERETLKKFGKHLRNAVAHRRVEFSSDSGDFDDVRITFRDKANGKDAVINWCATISAADLRTFCLGLIDLLENSNG